MLKIQKLKVKNQNFYITHQLFCRIELMQYKSATQQEFNQGT